MARVADPSGLRRQPGPLGRTRLFLRAALRSREERPSLSDRHEALRCHRRRTPAFKLSPVPIPPTLRPLQTQANEMLNDWSGNIGELLDKLEKTCHLIHKENMVHKIS